MSTPKTYPLRYCTGGCANGRLHEAHVYNVDPVDGPLRRDFLCPGNLRQVKEWLDEDGEGTLTGFIDEERARQIAQFRAEEEEEMEDPYFDHYAAI